jgi:hypothetical protein
MITVEYLARNRLFRHLKSEPCGQLVELDAMSRWPYPVSLP